MTDRSTELKEEMTSMLGLEAQGRLDHIREIDIKDIDRKELSSIEKYLLELKMAEDIFRDRNAIYKDTFVHLGLLGTTVTLVGDVFRLRNMILHNPNHGREYIEQIEDKLLDVINQAAISLMMLHDRNFEGK